MKHTLKKTFDGVPMWYSTQIARSAGATHGWSVKREDADRFPDEGTAQRYIDRQLAGDPEVKVDKVQINGAEERAV